MGLKKGQTNNPDGRPVGALSEKRKEWESMGSTLLGSWTDYITEYGNQLIKEDRFDDFYPLYKDMVNYFKPKMQSTTIDANIDTTPKIIFQDISGKEVEDVS